MKHNHELEKAIQFDGLSEAERVLGQSYKENDAVAWAGFALQQQNDEKLNALLHLNRDTNSWDQTIEEWEDIVQEMGFELVLEDAILGTADFLRIRWNKTLSALLCYDTYCGRSINSAKCYFFIAMEEFSFPLLQGCSHGPVSGHENMRHVDYDSRQGLRNILDRISTSKADFVLKWPETPFLWLLHYMDTKKAGYDYKAISAERIARLPEEVQFAIIP